MRISRILFATVLISAFVMFGFIMSDGLVYAKDWDSLGGESGGMGIYNASGSEKTIKAYDSLWGWIGTFLGIVSSIVTVFLVFHFLMAVKGYSTIKDSQRAAAEKQKAFNVGILAIISGFVGVAGISLGMGIIDFFVPK